MANMPKFKLSEKAKKRAAKIRATKAAETPKMEGGPKPPKVEKPKWELSQPKPKVETPTPEAPKQTEISGKGKVKATKAQLEERAAARRVRSRGEARSRAAAARQVEEGGITRPKPKGMRERLRTRTQTPKPATAATTQVAQESRIGRFGSEKFLKEGSRVVPFSRGKATAEGANLLRRVTRATGRAVAPAVRRVAPGLIAGASLGAQIAGTRFVPERHRKLATEIGAVTGAGLSAWMPRLMTRAALPLATVEGIHSTYVASKEYKKAKEAYGHLKKQAQGLKKAGYRVRAQKFGSAITGVRLNPKKKGGFFGEATFTEAAPGITLEKVSEGQYTPGAAPPWAKKKKRR